MRARSSAGERLAVVVDLLDVAAGGIRGALFRPGRPFKKPIAMRLDADVLDWFQRQGPGYQTRINAALREYMDHHRGD